MILLSVGVVKMKTSLRIVTTVLTSSMFLLSSCEDGGGDSSSSSSSSSGGSFAESRDVGLSFNLTDAVALVTSEDLIEVDRSAVRSMSRDGRSLLNYRVARADDDGIVGAANLVAVDNAGNAKLAMETNLPVKIMYSVANPAGTKVYLALDPGWNNNNASDNQDYSRFIAETNCALLEVEVSTNDYTCVAEGRFVAAMDEDYMKAVSGNQKPIQFDQSGNMYFSATSFSRDSDSWQDCYWDQANEREICEEVTNYWLSGGGNWMPIVYQYAADGTITSLSLDTEQVGFFIVLPTGEVVYQSYNEDTRGNGLKIIREDGSVAEISNPDVWTAFFAIDSSNTIVYGTENWGSTDAPGIQFARPDLSGTSTNFANLDTSLFGSNNQQSNGWSNPTPRRVILADDGRLYGMFEGGRNDWTEDDGWVWTTTLKVFQILPYDAVPKLELELGQDWWSWMRNMPFQIVNGHLYYTEPIFVGGQGEADLIKMVNLDTREVTTLLHPIKSYNPWVVKERYSISSWRLSGDILYFSALEGGTRTVVMGEIDTNAVMAGKSPDQYLTINEAASASGVASAIKDMEVIKNKVLVDDGNWPLVLEVFAESENMFSVSVDFSEPMDFGTVERTLKLTSDNQDEGNKGEIPFMSVWIANTLHMIPDLQSSQKDVPTWWPEMALLYPTTVPMTYGETYTLTGFAHTMTDRFGNAIEVPTFSGSENKAIIRPENGWYTGSLTQSIPAAVATEGVLKFAAPADLYQWKSFTLHNDLPENFRLEFSAINYGWDGVKLIVFDKENETARGSKDQWQDTIITARLGSWSHTEYAKGRNWVSGRYNKQSTGYQNGESREVFNGKWSRYRMDVFGKNIQYSVSADGVTFTSITVTGSEKETASGTEPALTFDAIEKDNEDKPTGKADFMGLADKNDDGNAVTEYHLVMRTVNAIALDNLELSTLDDDGELVTTGGKDLLDWNGSSRPTNLDAAVSYGFANW
jgi:hypothetical protein